MKTIAGLLSLALLLLLQAGGVVRPDVRLRDHRIVQEAGRSPCSNPSRPSRTPRSPRGSGRRSAAWNPSTRRTGSCSPRASTRRPSTPPSPSSGTRREESTQRIALAEESRRDKAQIEADAKTIGEISQQNVEYRASVEQLTLKVSDLSAQHPEAHRGEHRAAREGQGAAAREQEGQGVHRQAQGADRQAQRQRPGPGRAGPEDDGRPLRRVLEGRADGCAAARTCSSTRRATTTWARSSRPSTGT